METSAVTKTRWGSYESLSRGLRYQVKRLIVKPGQRLSKQYHYHRKEIWLVTEGVAFTEVDGFNRYLYPGESIKIALGDVHRLSNEEDTDLVIIETQYSPNNVLEEEDIVRVEDDYGRADG